MVSTKTQIAGFEFDNCLMNAAGVACMTIEELEGVKNSTAGTFVTKTATLDFRQGNPEPRYQDVPLGSINSMGLPNKGLDYYLDYLLDLQEKEPNRTFFLSLVGMSPEETHTILKNSKRVSFDGLTELKSLLSKMFQVNLRLPMILRQQTGFWQKYLTTSPNLLELNCHHILILFTLTKRQLFSISILLSLSTVLTLSETAFI